MRQTTRPSRCCSEVGETKEVLSRGPLRKCSKERAERTLFFFVYEPNVNVFTTRATIKSTSTLRLQESILLVKKWPHCVRTRHPRGRSSLPNLSRPLLPSDGRSDAAPAQCLAAAPSAVEAARGEQQSEDPRSRHGTVPSVQRRSLSPIPHCLSPCGRTTPHGQSWSY